MEPALYEQKRQANLLLAQQHPRDLSEQQLTTIAAAKSASGSCDNGVLMSGETGLEVTVTVRMRQIPTSFVHLLDPRLTPLVTFEIHNHRDTTVRLRIGSRVVRLSAEAIDTIEIPAGDRATIDQLPVFFADRICEVTETRAASLLVRVDDLDGTLQRERSYRTILLPRTAAYLGVDDGHGGVVDFTHYLAAWVTPNVPVITQLLREAAALHPQRQIPGYQMAGAATMADSVHAQVEAVFVALKATGIVYVNSVGVFSLAGEAFVQRIRLPREALRDRSANCIDGVVLMASVLEAASLDVAIALVPGHAFIGYSTAPSAEQWSFLETTLIGTSDFAAARAAGDDLADRSSNAGVMHVLPLSKLRTDDEIFPME